MGGGYGTDSIFGVDYVLNSEPIKVILTAEVLSSSHGLVCLRHEAMC
jgi:hypothetical protein